MVFFELWNFFVKNKERQKASINPERENLSFLGSWFMDAGSTYY